VPKACALALRHLINAYGAGAFCIASYFSGVSGEVFVLGPDGREGPRLRGGTNRLCQVALILVACLTPGCAREGASVSFEAEIIHEGHGASEKCDVKDDCRQSAEYVCLARICMVEPVRACEKGCRSPEKCGLDLKTHCDGCARESACGASRICEPRGPVTCVERDFSVTDNGAVDAAAAEDAE